MPGVGMTGELDREYGCDSILGSLIVESIPYGVSKD